MVLTSGMQLISFDLIYEDPIISVMSKPTVKSSLLTIANVILHNSLTMHANDHIHHILKCFSQLKVTLFWNAWVGIRITVISYFSGNVTIILLLVTKIWFNVIKTWYMVFPQLPLLPIQNHHFLYFYIFHSPLHYCVDFYMFPCKCNYHDLVCMPYSNVDILGHQWYIQFCRWILKLEVVAFFSAFLVFFKVLIPNSMHFISYLHLNIWYWS